MTKNNIIVIVVLAVLVVGLAIFGLSKAKAPVTDGKVATVNGVVITKTAYDEQVASLTASLQAQGVNTTDPAKQTEINKQALDNLINNELVAEGIKSSGIVATDAEVETQFQATVTQSGGQDGFKAALTKANLTEAQLRTNIKNQLEIQKYLAANVKVDGITVSDSEISAFYTEYSKAQGTSTPALKDISAQIKQQITLNKQQTLINDFVASLRAKANVQTFI
jgi:FKBP-type peptidyl-prolyl cis-trans isomerase (trigger factor)